ncbi:uncharacterized protein GGS22DRAFT_139640 [Annulohypoxylon maeteangense]|uniref:uncharacterized protein n=1 Tax=Annulohypoxylon maeteangense TaxID=1927788 RepID=UPI002007FCD6|nr:uncharacterized protein GGS22DRAFT_139640 [Annulohypoxylon maeteangense]KAI0885162.1 hypothetical protein GGS22DRAFT_139640 [Annulohypoxylon maeteangense]
MDSLSQAERGQTSTTITPERRDNDISVTSSQDNQTTEANQLCPMLQETDPGSLSSETMKIISSQEILTDTLKSWARAAALQSLSHNLSHHRRYDTLWHRVLLNEQSEITRMEKMLADLDKRDENESNSTSRRPKLGPDTCVPTLCRCPSHKNIACGGNSKNHREDDTTANSVSNPCTRKPCDCNEEDFKSDLSETILKRLKRYSESVLLLHRLQKIPQTTRREWSSLYHTLKGEGVLEGSDWDFLSFQDDFVSTRTERADQTFAALVYGNAPLSRLFRWLFKNRNHGRTGDEVANKTTIYLHTGGMESLKKGLVAAGSGIILMVPVGILLLLPMGKVNSLIVVVCFGAAFVFALMLLGKTFDTMLIGFSAYSAVLVTFLANTQGGGNCTC